jgi:hypothetical protein
MGDALGDNQSGLHLKTDKLEVAASDGSVSSFLDFLSHLWFGTIDRMIEHPVFGFLVLILVLVIVDRFFRARREKYRLEIEFRKWRETISVQKSLPFHEIDDTITKTRDL